MSSFNDYCEVINYNNEDLAVYLKVTIDNKLYYICEKYRVFKMESNEYIEVKDKKVMKVIKDMLTLERD